MNATKTANRFRVRKVGHLWHVERKMGKYAWWWALCGTYRHHAQALHDADHIARRTKRQSDYALAGGAHV